MKVNQLLEIPYEGEKTTCTARQKIDDDISELKCRIQSLRTKRNELAPISTLPPEVLSNIFIVVRDLSIYGSSFGSRKSNHHAPWIRVGHICRHWREIALNCPNLWSVPVFTRPNLTQKMIELSKTAPLTVRSVTGDWYPNALEQVKIVLAQVTRVQSIELALGGNQDRLEHILSMLSQPTPLLESLDLSGPIHNDLIPFPQDALSDAPRLRSISLNGLVFSWNSAVFENTALTHLRLTGSPSDTSTMGEMMDALHHLPNLRVLALDDSIPPYIESDGNIRTVEFKFLERLDLIAEAADSVFPFLRHIRYPSFTTVKLDSLLTYAEDGITTISLLGQNFCRIGSVEAGIHRSPVVIHSARLTSAINSVDIAFFNRTDSINKLYETDGLDPAIQIRLDSVSDFFTQAQPQGQFLTSITDSFDLSSLEEVLLNWSFTKNHICAIRDSLGELPKLKTIKISQSLSEICIALAETRRDGKSRGNSTDAPLRSQGSSQLPSSLDILFPALETLMLQGVDFTPDRYRVPGGIDRLIDMLRKRSKAKLPIDHLSLERCPGLPTWQIRQLGELVAHLEIDGEVIDVESLRSDEDDDNDEDGSSDDGISIGGIYVCPDTKQIYMVPTPTM